MIPSLNTAIEEVLQQGCTFLDGVGDLYDRPLEGSLEASLGAHYRHVLDHFLCLMEGIRTGHINYDERGRNSLLESSVTQARLVTERLIDEFRGLSQEILRRECTVTYSVDYVEGGAERVPSNLAREVMFCVGHAVHHYAILKLLSAKSEVELPCDFGIAPSTLRHRLGAEAVERA
jgi:hypothetical protein